MNNNPIIDFPGNLHQAVFNVIQFFGVSAQIYWKIAASVFVLLLIFIAFVNFFKTSNSETFSISNLVLSKTTFIIFIIIGILILRAPIFILFELNPDESQWMVGAATLIKDPRFWLSVDGTTSGPLVIVPLCIIYFFGSSINYATVRLFGLLVCIIPSIFFSYATFVRLFGDRIARIIILPFALFMALVSNNDFVAYNSEYMPLLLMSISIYIYSRIYISERIGPSHLILIGFFLGCIPYAKLQAVPIALTIAFFTYLRIIILYRNNIKSAVKLSVILTVGGFLPSIFTLVYLLYTGIFKVFWQSYILMTLAYPEYYNPQSNIFERFLMLPRLIIKSESTIYFGYLSSTVVIFFFFIYKFNISLLINSWESILFSISVFLASYFSIIFSGSSYDHYLLLFVSPALLLSGILMGKFYCAPQNIKLSFLKKFLLITASLVLLVSSFYNISLGSNGIRKRCSILRYNNKKKLVICKINEFAQPNDKMAVWGWINHYYIQTGLIQGTREPHTRHQIGYTKYQKHFLDRYVYDLKENKPKVFLDVVSKASLMFKNKNEFSHKNFPKIREIIDNNYVFISEIDEIEIYIRK